MCLWTYFDTVYVCACLSYKPISFGCVVQLAGLGGGSEHGWAGQQEQQPAEEKATMAQTGHPNYSADAGWCIHTHPGKNTSQNSGTIFRIVA